MKTDIVYGNFIEAIKIRIPKRGELTNALADMLGIEKEAIYRRLRGEVPFTFSEISTIAIKLGISLDSIAEGLFPVSRPFNLRIIKFIDPDEEDYKMLNSFKDNINYLKEDPDSELGSISSIIPSSLCVTYKYIYKFSIFKCLYQFGEPEDIKSYADTIIPDRVNQINKEYVKNVQQSPSSIYIFDEHFIEYLVNDIFYFYETRLISQDDVEDLREDLLLFLSDLRRYANSGKFDLGGKVRIYISNIHFDANYNYIDSKDYKMSMIRSFSLSDAYSLDKKIFENVKRWTHFLKRTATLISESGEIQRIRFFERQMEIVNSLAQPRLSLEVV